MKTNTIETDLDAIRHKLYEQTKDMTTSERVAFFNNSADRALEKYGIKTVKMESIREKLYSVTSSAAQQN